MEIHLILGISIYFLLFIIVLHGALVVTIRPKFFYQFIDNWELIHPAIISAIFFLLFMISFCLGAFSYGLRIYNGLLYF